jgi:Na+-driven multidrug efflux pump
VTARSSDRRLIASIAVPVSLEMVSQVVKVRNMILGAGVMPSGGDVRGVVLELFTPLGVIGLFVARVIEECVRLAILTARTRRISWAAVVLRETAANA